jgi:hypothetical protein
VQIRHGVVKIAMYGLILRWPSVWRLTTRQSYFRDATFLLYSRWAIWLGANTKCRWSFVPGIGTR